MIKKIVKKFLGKRLSLVYSTFIRFYRYRLDLTRVHDNSWIAGCSVSFYCLWRFFIDKKTVLFYPQGPQEFHAMYKLLNYLGYRTTCDHNARFDLGIQWWLAFDGNPFAPADTLAGLLNDRRNGHHLLNLTGLDISKQRVGKVFEEVFGYSLKVDPRRHTGKCVMKLNWNALHKGKVVDCPTEPVDDDVVYQRLIRNELGDGTVEDMRVPIFYDLIPFIYLKYRSVNERLIDRVHTNTKAIIAEVDDCLSREEQQKICQFSRQMGLDYCEVDVLRDRDNGRIYIVDANNTPSGPPSPIDPVQGKTAVVRLADAFQRAFEK